MPAYKLNYFNARGRAELCRLIFAQAGVEYEDNRIEREAWPELKPNMTFGQVPELEVDGQHIAQTNAMARYLAKQFNLAGKTAIEEALVDMVADTFEDLFMVIVKIIFGKTDEEKKEATDKVPGQLANIEAYLLKQNGGDGYFVGDSVTWADLKAFDLISNLKKRMPDALKESPTIMAHTDRIGALPNIKKWVETRPETEM